MKNSMLQRRLSATLTSLVLLAVVVSALGLAQKIRAAYYFVMDQFGTAAYNNNDGSANWSSNWTETNDDNSATGGNVQITGGYCASVAPV